jgi:hypothetical protein
MPTAVLCSCTSLNIIHDPETGIIGREQVVGIVRSTKCELITFFEANQHRSKNYFDLSQSLFGNVIFDLNVIDTAGFPQGGTSLDNLHTINPNSSFTWHFGPTLNGQNTYDMTLGFIVPQNATLSSKANEFTCYSSPSNDYEGLAEGRYPKIEQFTRVRVNGVKPLASWLLEVASSMWPEMEAAKLGETAYPVQMAYNFTVQITGGLEVKYSLINPVWSALAPDAAVSSEQTGKLTFTLNGADASLAGGASLGTAVIGNGTQPYEPPTPPRRAPNVAGGPAPQPAPAPPAIGHARRRLLDRGQPHGYLIAPLPLPAPRPVH